MLVGAMKWLVTKRFLVPSQIEIRPKQHVKCDLAKEVVRDARVPNGLGTFVNARIEHRERGVELIRDHLFECVQHQQSLPRSLTSSRGLVINGLHYWRAPPTADTPRGGLTRSSRHAVHLKAMSIYAFKATQLSRWITQPVSSSGASQSYRILPAKRKGRPKETALL